ncbi:MAG: VanZ family protein [Fibrobacter sp.]|nr:VanZ family protein [Fibrobacter sp.]
MFESIFAKYPFFRTIPAVLCMAVIFKISSMTADELQGLPHVWDKLAHTCEYATLAGCFSLWWTRVEWSKKIWLRILVVVILTLVYGCTDEFHQRFVEGRSCDAIDLVADTLGGLIGGSVYALICKLLNKYDPLSSN